jgi:hypothetical protein
MNRHHALVLLCCLVLLFVAGCEQTSIAQQEQIKSFETLQASTPSTTPTSTETPTPTSTPTPTMTVGPSPTPTVTPTPTPTAVPTATPLPPTPTPNPALANFSLCNQTAGETDGGRFSAKITGITTTIEPAFERVTIGLAVPGDSAPPHANASCLSAADEPPGGAASGYIVHVDLDGWLHDDAFKATTISPTRALSGTTVLKSLNERFDQNAAAGATLAFGMEQPLPFRLALEKDPYRLILEIAKTGAVGANNDMLSLPATSSARPSGPLFYLQDGDIWKFADGKATNLTKDARQDNYGDITALDANLTAGRVAFCAIASGADVGDQLAPSVLWSIDLDGKDARALAVRSRTCADPTFAPDGKTLAFAADETGATPPRLSIWTVSAGGGDEQRVTAADDEWSRFGPRWLDGSRLVYAAVSEDGRSTLFVRTANGAEQDIGADLVKGDTYKSLGRPLAAPDGSAIAVEGQRANADGADLLLIDATGAALANQGPIGSGYWNRPLAWGADGTLYYLSSACASEVAQSYTIHARSLKDGGDKLVAAGTALGGIGRFAATDKGLAYVTLARAPAGPRGPLDIDHDSPSTLWFWDIGGTGARGKLAEAQSAISDLAP